MGTNEVLFASGGWIIFIVIIVGLFIVIMGQADTLNKKSQEFNKKENLTENDYIWISSFVSGHPKIDESFDNAAIINKGSELLICKHLKGIGEPECLASINKELVSDLQIEDSSSIEKRITVGRLLLVGVFAFAWKKAKKNELAFLVISWKDRFSHETIFSFNGQNALQEANKARNTLIKFLS